MDRLLAWWRETCFQARHWKPQGSTENKTTAAANPDPGFINIDARGDKVSVLSQPSFVQYAQYELFLASGGEGKIRHLQEFGIMEDDDDCSGSIDLDEFSFFQLGRATPSYATVLKQGAKGARGYAAAAAALSGIPATHKVPTKMKRVPTKKRATTDPNKLYLDRRLHTIVCLSHGA